MSLSKIFCTNYRPTYRNCGVYENDKYQRTISFYLHNKGVFATDRLIKQYKTEAKF